MALPDVPDNTMVSKILSEINMNERDLDDAVISMKQWINKQPHLPPAASDDNLLKGYIIGCKSVERAKAKLENYFTFRNTFHDLIFKDWDPTTINWKAATNKIIILPGMTQEGYKVAFALMPNESELDDFSPNEVLRVQYMSMDLLIRDNYMSSGLCVIVDLANLCVEFTLKISMSLSAAASKIMQEGYPMRMKLIVAVNAPPLAETFFNTFLKPFFNKKLKNRIFIHSEDHTIVSKYIPLEMLPSNYAGGKSPSFEAQWDGVRKKLESERDWFLNQGSQSVNENLRPKPDNDEMKGTFRKLQIE